MKIEVTDYALEIRCQWKDGHCEHSLIEAKSFVPMVTRIVKDSGVEDNNELIEVVLAVRKRTL